MDDPDGGGGGECDGRAGTDAATPPGLARRRLLATAGGAGLVGLAGCGGGDDGDGTTSPSENAPTSEPSPTATTAAPATTTAPSGTTAATSTTYSTTRPSTTPPTTTVDVGEPRLVAAPGSRISPLDGWADVGWLEEADPTIHRVTTLAASGEGSLRAALEAEGPRVVIFEVGGTIDLGDHSGLGTESPELFVAGQTAPSPGITVARGDLTVREPNVVVQHLRVRPGDEAGGPVDAMRAGTESHNVIFDHCSATWGVDECMSTGGGASNEAITFSNNLIAEGLSDSIHPKGPHSKGTLVLNDSQDVAVFGNVYTDNVQRNPRLKGGTSSAVANNLVYNFGVAIGMGRDSDRAARSGIVGNHFIAGPDTDRDTPIVHGDGEPVPIAAVADTIVEPSTIPLVGDGVERKGVLSVWPESVAVDPMPASDVYAHNLAAAGARPADRSPQDRRAFDEVRTRSGGVIDSQSEVGGFPDLPSTERALDPPAWGDGFTEWLFEHTVAVELGRPSPAD
ncbi:MAG: polysaccharide lyase family 1 protein [Halobacteriaceae archaeon]